MGRPVLIGIVSSLLLSVIPGGFARADQPPAFLLKWGSKGSGEGQFETPRGIAVDAASNVYVADYGNHRIQKFSANGIFMTQWYAGNAWGVAADAAGNIYVADYVHDVVRKYSGTGGLLAELSRGDRALSYPSGVAVDHDGNVYVVDGHSRIQKFAGNGVFLTSWGSTGIDDGQLSYATGIAVGADGSVYVADTGNSRIQKFTGTGAFLLKWGSDGVTSGKFRLPEGVTVGDDGNVYVADTQNQRVQKFTPGGLWLTQWGSSGSNNGNFLSPRGIAAGAGLDLYVSDVQSSRIQKFGEGATGVGDGLEPGFGLDLPQPNPSSDRVTLRFQIPRTEHVDLGIYDLTGRRVATLAQGEHARGPHRAIWNLRAAGGPRIAPGVYFSRFEAGSFVAVRKLVVAD